MASLALYHNLASDQTWAMQVASIGLYVQAFFCHRLWIISKKNHWFVVPIIVVLLFAYVSICLAVRLIGLLAKFVLFPRHIDILYLSWSNS